MGRELLGDAEAVLAGLLLVVAAASIFLLPEGVSRSYDWGLQAAWIERFYDQLSASEFWPQWIHDADAGRGQPVFVFYPPFAYWLAAAFRAISGDAVLALKLAELTSLVLVYCSCVALFRRTLGPTTAVAMGVATTLSPAILFLALRVHMIAATLALAATPWIIGALTSDQRSLSARILTLALAVAFAGWSHLLSLMMCCVLASLLAINLLWVGKRPIHEIIPVLGGGLLLGNALCLAATWPAIFESTSISTTALTEGALNWRRNFLLDPFSTASGFRVDYRFLSLAALTLIVFSLLAGFKIVATRKPPPTAARSTALVALLGVAMTTPIAWPLYSLIPAFALLQFPWRWLPMLTIVAMFTVASRIPVSKSPWRWWASALLVAAVGWGSIVAGSALLPTRPRTTPEEQTRVIAAAPRSTPEYRPMWLSISDPEPSDASVASSAFSSSDRIRIERIGSQPFDTRWQIDAAEPGTVNLGIACFPGWTAALNQREVSLGCDERGRLQVAVTSGQHHLYLHFAATPPRIAARAVSGVAALVWLALFGLVWRSRHRPSND